MRLPFLQLRHDVTAYVSHVVGLFSMRNFMYIYRITSLEDYCGRYQVDKVQYVDEVCILRLTYIYVHAQNIYM